MKFKILARHEWVSGATITESGRRDDMVDDPGTHRFTATIRGFGNWRIYQGVTNPEVVHFVIQRVKNIRDRIDAKDEAVFHEPNDFATTIQSD